MSGRGRYRYAAVVAVMLAVLSFGACRQESGPATLEEIALGAMVEQSRGHLAVALENARAGRWDLAAVHAAHPAETQQAISAALSKRDVTGSAVLRSADADVVRAAQSKDLALLGSLVSEQDARYARVAATVLGESRAADLSYRASVVATLVASVADEYDEAVDGGRIVQEAEYQDAYAFLGRAGAIWREIEPQVAATHAREHDAVVGALEGLARALPSLAPPAAVRSSADVGALAETVRNELGTALRAATGVAGSAAFAAASERLDGAVAALDRGDATAAALEVRAFTGAWGAIEGTVKARSAGAYKAIEDDTAAAMTALAKRPADTAAARAAIERVGERLAQVETTPSAYGVVDAAIILVREGLEALLVMGALLAFLVKSGNADKRGWIWAGGAAGIAASIFAAALVNVAFSAGAAAGLDAEVLEGLTGLFAAAMLLYVSWWMHSKTSLRTWERYVHDKTNAALAGNSLLGLALIAFLAVFREGAETTLFYLGMAPSIALSDLLLGLAAGALGLALAGVAMIVFSVRIPVRPFFLVASVLIYYLAFKFVGTGIRALQVAGIVPATSGGLPEIPLLAVYPTWETTAVQLVLLVAALGYLVYDRSRPRPAAATA